MTATAGEDFKYGTYWRDGAGLDYADQRYYTGSVGRFLTADPYVASAVVSVPATMNLYGYVGDDPTNLADPTGREPYCGPKGVWMGEGCYSNYNAYEGGTARGYAAPVPWDASASMTSDPFSTVSASGIGTVATGSNMGAGGGFGDSFGPLAGAGARGAVIGIDIVIGGISVGSGVWEVVAAVVVGASVTGAVIYGGYEISQAVTGALQRSTKRKGSPKGQRGAGLERAGSRQDL